MTTSNSVWVLVVEPQWGSRGQRKEVLYFFQQEPSKEVVQNLAGGHHHDLHEQVCGEPFEITTYH